MGKIYLVLFRFTLLNVFRSEKREENLVSDLQNSCGNLDILKTVDMMSKKKKKISYCFYFSLRYLKIHYSIQIPDDDKSFYCLGGLFFFF